MYFSHFFKSILTTNAKDQKINKALFFDPVAEDNRNKYIKSGQGIGWHENMVLKTFSDCTQCPFITKCDAHISGGTHKHQEGPDPCEMNINPDQ